MTSPVLPTLPEILRLQARRRGADGGLVYDGRRATFGEVSDAVEGLGGWLARIGLGSGHRVVVLAGNTPAMVGAAYALWGLGVVVVPVSPRATASEVARVLDHSSAAGIFCDAVRSETAREAARAAAVPAWVCRSEMPFSPRRADRRHVGRPRGPRVPELRSIAAISYTSGTSGAPKGVVLSHANLLWATLACGQARGDTADVVGTCLSPLSHVPVLVSHLLCRVAVGATAVLVEKFEVDAVLGLVERHGVSDLSLVGGMVFDVVGRRSVPSRVASTVRKVSVGGAPTAMAAKESLAALFPRAEVIEAYGQTESTDGVVMARRRSVFERPGTVGVTNPYVVVGIRRADGTLAVPGEEGEIVVAGPTVMVGYHRGPRATAAALRDGWLHTGDLGHQDADGYLWVTGRSRDLVITGGENVVPAEVEEVLRAHPAVADVAVLGTPHPRWGEQVTAVVVRRSGSVVDADALSAFAGSRLARFKVPRRIEFVASLPRNATNKVETHVLRRRFGV